MDDRPARATRELERAARRADAELRDQLRSIEESLRDVIEGDAVSDATYPDRLSELEERLGDIGEETDGDVHRHVATAEALIYGYRTTLLET